MDTPSETEDLEAAADFEFERRFLVTDFPAHLRDAPTLVVQSYYLADAGYALRVRAQGSGVEAGLDAGSSPLDVLEAHRDALTMGSVTVKGPSVGGTRYESERQVDPGVAVEMIRRGGAAMVKTRYSVWAGGDGWSVDVFGGPNAPLVVAECERSGPVTDLEIPAFCVTELTDDLRFSNESLASRPYGEWTTAYLAELAATGPAMRGDFGTNARLLPD
ncbi:CYTH domain-containing protein [Litorihabitans aurantiacus]|uniref:CYTH domain-containing protein n=1 Tax=Litorihabitans aurantiacus TaxID=1930061 RepID=A0AA37XCQ3_9MICO|nr:CYTH domain-containing protein [Litorihabitans aurantiacus]GMA30481.1 hypothetical protein GCM10025875_04730 [Litorihabitans aurantiacus]